MALLVDNWCYRIPGMVEAESSLDYRKVHERLQRVLRLRSNKTMRLIVEQDKHPYLCCTIVRGWGGVSCCWTMGWTRGTTASLFRLGRRMAFSR